MSGIYTLNQQPAKQKASLMDMGWPKVNFYNTGLGLIIGTVISLLFSIFQDKWIGWNSFIFQLVISTIITLCISNCIYFSYRLLKFNRNKMWLFTGVYYLASSIGMLTSIELIFWMQSLLFKKPYHFLHFKEAQFALIIGFVICTLILIYSLQKWGLKEKLQEKELDLLKLQQMKTQAELAALQSKINPHFLCNSLNAIASLIPQDPEKAEKMTIQLSKLFRYSVYHNRENLVMVKEEMEIVSIFLDIEKVRFGDRINFQLEIEEEILQEKIPRFLIQPLVENALKHGLKDVVKDAILKIELKKLNKGQLVIAITDNGIPFPDELEVGYGLQSTYDKLSLLYGSAYELQIMNTPVKQIKIHLPL